MDFEERLHILSHKRVALLQGSEAAIAKQRALGRLLAQERVEKLLDPGTFVQTDIFASEGNAVTGYGLVNDRPVYVLAQDATSAGGAMSVAQARKMIKTLDLAEKTGAPVVLMPDARGAKIGEGAQVLAAYAQVFAKLAKMRNLCPIIALAAGQATATASNFIALSDIAVAVEGKAEVTPFSASVMNAVADTALDSQALGGAVVLARKGAVAITAKDEEEGLALVRTLIDLLPSSAYEKAPMLDGDDLNRLLKMPPESSQALALDIVDHSTSIELYGAWRNTCRTYIARVGGNTCGIVSCVPEQDGGRLDAFACDKIAKLVSFCDAYDLPVITLVDSEGLAVPSAEGQSWLMTASARMLCAYAEATTPKVAVITGNAVGAAYVAFAGKAIADICFAWPGAYIAPLTTAATVQTFDAAQLNETDRATLEAKAADEADAFGAATEGLVDDVIEPAQTRKHLIAALELLATKHT